MMLSQPPDDRAMDELNALLDREGKNDPLPLTANQEDDLVLMALVRASAPVSPPENDLLDDIWRNVMTTMNPIHVQQHSRPPVNPPASALAQPPQRTASFLSRTHRLSTWISTFAVVALLVGMVGVVWSMQGGSDDGTQDLAALPSGTLSVGSATAAEIENDTFRWPTAEDCTVAPMPFETYAKIMSTQPDISQRTYQVTGVPDHADAIAAAEVAQLLNACTIFGNTKQQRSLETPAFLFFSSISMYRTISDAEVQQMRIIHGTELSTFIQQEPTSVYMTITDVAPSAEYQSRANELYPSIGFDYDPQKALLLSDGRIAIPPTIVFWSGDVGSLTQDEIDRLSTLPTDFVILKNDGSSWKVDEGVPFCSAQLCNAMPVDTGSQNSATPSPPIATPAPRS